jgi:hypothetical protein
MNIHLNSIPQQQTPTSKPADDPQVQIADKLPADQSLQVGGKLIPFLLESKQQSWITRDLCRLLNQRNHTTVLCNIDESVPFTTAPLIDERGKKHSGGHEYCLLPLHSPQSIRNLQLSHAVFPVSANLDAVCRAYKRIKLLAKAPPEIGIVMVGPRDQHAAWRYFRKLAVGTLRYLDIPLLNLGFLPDQITPPFGAADHHRDNFLTRVSERLIRSEFHMDAFKESG